MTDELHIITGEQMEQMKKTGLEVIDMLPADPKAAYLVILFVKEHFEKVTGLTEKGVQVLLKNDGK